MNKTLLSAALFAATAAFVVAPGAARAADGQIDFSGQISAQTCQINGNAAGTSVTLPTVTLPAVSAAVLATNGAVAGNTPFQIDITGCDSALTTVATLFSGSNIDAATSSLKNTAAGGATNVQLQLLNGDSSAIKLNSTTAAGQNSKPATLSGGAATLNYIARYRSQGSATAGAVTSNVQFTMIYQ